MWTGDVGAWPIMCVITAAIALPIVAGIRKIVIDPDARLSKDHRKTLFRGALANEDAENAKA